MGDVSGREAGRALAQAHLLLLPDGTAPDAVADLVLQRSPGAAREDEGDVVVLRTGRYAALRGPLRLDAGAAATAAVPPPWRTAWALTCPRERGTPPLPGATDRDGLHRAFPDGLPVDDERRAVELGLALARRLGGAVRVAPSGALLQPDRDAWIDRTVHSRYWLPPEAALEAAAAAVPSAELAMDGQVWQGLSFSAVRALEAPGAGVGLTDAQREGLHLAADRRDAAAMAEPDALDAYALVVRMGPEEADAEEGVVEVLVGGAEELPPSVAAQPWAASAVSYRVVWWPAEEHEAETEHPAEEFCRARAEAAAVVERLAAALAEACGGLVVDAEGFPVR
ncbi:hypothetical protein [Quadrisphaera sp. DSM 44207]|uniref:hypothetical protein n=1 Tax=Quadrisphaera sp. DSM 44207 TaxID=1881057 RepID=UPI00087FCE7C|nr:hypothetical protein [Quadrisphaera sp. DSM 44207]SDQ88570.1 hypothetical protein SAMN05428996_3026 [Quadrisphaera sp. DSM 44207]